MAWLQEVLQTQFEGLGQDLVHAFDGLLVDPVGLFLGLGDEFAFQQSEGLFDRDSCTHVHLCLEHLKSSHRVALILDRRVHSLGEFLNKLDHKSVGEDKLTSLVLHENDCFVRTNKIDVPTLQVLGRLGLHGHRIRDVVGQIDLEESLERQIFELGNADLIVPLVPASRKGWAHLGIIPVNSVVQAWPIQLVHECLVRRCWTVSVVLHSTVARVVIQEVLQRDPRIFLAVNFPLKVVVVGDVIFGSLHATSHYFLVLHVLLHTLRHVAAFHKSSVHLRSLSGILSDNFIAKLLRFFIAVV